MCTQFSQTLIKPQLYPVIFINHSQSSNGEWPCIHDILCITETRSRKHWCVYMMMKVARQGTGSSSSSVAQLCPTLCNPIDCSMPGFPVHYELPDFTQTHVHWVGDAIQPSHPLMSPSPPAFHLSQHQGHQSTGVSASASVLPMNIQDQFPLGWTSWISLQSKGLSRVFSNTTVQKHQFFSTQLSL